MKRAHGQDWELKKCGGCGHGFIANRPTFAELREFYARDGGGEANFPYVQASAEKLEARADCRTLIEDIVSFSKATGRSLDIGSGSGGFSYHLARRGYAPTMIDLDARATHAARAVPNSNFHVTSFEDLLDPGPYAAIVMSQVLEHALDPMDWLRRSRAWMTSGGVLAIAVPNFGGLYALFGMRDPFITPPIHLNYFTAKSLRVAFEQVGLRPLAFRSRSDLIFHVPVRELPVKKRVIRSAWNPVSRVLNGTSRGIILRAYARRD